MYRMTRTNPDFTAFRELPFSSLPSLTIKKWNFVRLTKAIVIHNNSAGLHVRDVSTGQMRSLATKIKQE